MMMMVSLIMLVAIVGVLNQFTSRYVTIGVAVGIFMGMASVLPGFSAKFVGVLPQRK